MVIPSEIYVNVNKFTNGKLRCQASRLLETDVKYVSENYIIEKAMRWLKNNQCIDDILSVEMLEDFRKYMKG